MSELAVVGLDTFLASVLNGLAFDITCKIKKVVTRSGIQYSVEFTGPDAGKLAENNGALLLALEHLAAMTLRLQPGQYEAINFDAAGFKEERERKVKAEAQRVLEQAFAQGQTYRSQPMSYRERFMLHKALAGYGLRSELVVDGRQRRLVIRAPLGSEAAFPHQLSAAG